MSSKQNAQTKSAPRASNTSRRAQKAHTKREPAEQRVYAFIDSQNLNLGTQKMGWKMDWAKFRRYLRDTHGVSRAYMFIGYVPEYEAMYEQLHDMGYLIVLRPTVDVSLFSKNEPANGPDSKDSAEPEKPSVKGNIDVELVLYAMKELSNYDQALIVSGDGDFYSLIEYLVEKKRLKNILTPNWQYSSLLKQFDDYIIRLDQLKHRLAYRHIARKKKPAPPA